MRSGGTISFHTQWFGYALPSGPWIVASHTPPGLKSNACVVILLPAHGAHHSARWVALVNASNTSRRGPSMMRETTISRSASVLASLAICMLLLLKFLHVLVEPVEVLVPVLLEANDPLVHRLEAARVEAVEPLLPGLADAHESHFAKHAQVLRRAWLRDPQCACKLIDRTLAPLKKDENPPPLRLGNRIERIGGRGGSCHKPNICPYRHMSRSKAGVDSDRGRDRHEPRRETGPVLDGTARPLSTSAGTPPARCPRAPRSPRRAPPGVNALGVAFVEHRQMRLCVVLPCATCVYRESPSGNCAKTSASTCERSRRARSSR